MAKSNPIAANDRNHLQFDYWSPQGAEGGLTFATAATAGTDFFKLNTATPGPEADVLNELTAGTGVTVDGFLIKDASFVSANDKYWQIKNAGGVAQDILKVSAADALTLSSLWNTAAVRTAIGCAKSGANSDITALSGLTGAIAGTDLPITATVNIGLLPAAAMYLGSNGAYRLKIDGDLVTPQTDNAVELGATGLVWKNIISTKFTLATQQNYTVTNGSTDRSLNVTGDTLAQVAAVLGTLISDLITAGLLK
jgi:hypothetical protein